MILIRKIGMKVLILLILSISLPANAAKKCPEGFSCIKVKRGQSWHKLFPDERERSIVMRVNHRNGNPYPGMTVKVPNDLEDADLLDYSPMPMTVNTEGEKLIIFDPAIHAWAAYDEDGDIVRWGPATGGKNWCSDIGEPCRTKTGEFRIYSLGSSNCVSSKFPQPDGGAPMPYCMFFHGGIAFHGSPGGVIKANASHGCVRMFVKDAEWLRYDFVDPPIASNDFRGTKVVVMPYADKKPKKSSDKV